MTNERMQRQVRARLAKLTPELTEAMRRVIADQALANMTRAEALAYLDDLDAQIEAEERRSRSAEEDQAASEPDKGTAH